MAPTRNICNT